MLQCGHSFCQTCIHNDWERNIVRECSLCKQLIPEGDPAINFCLKSLCENYGGRSQGEPSGHRNHTESFQTPPEDIREKQEALEETKKLFESSVERIKTQSFNTEKKIMDEFKRLHAFLDEDEKTRRAALRKEARQKIQKMRLMHENIKHTCLLSHTMRENGTFQANEIEPCVTEVLRKEMDMLNILTSSQGQINVSQHVENLPLAVLEKMRNNIKQTSVVVDPKTATSRLLVSYHPTNVNDTQQPSPRNPERSTSHQQNLWVQWQDYDSGLQ
ncbi:E3 ubiquitin-protein ligase TRIM35-like [Acanthopagrus schlegelii]